MSLPFVPRVTATVDLSALRHNLARARALAPGARVMAAIKADAYGHGALPVARTLVAAGVDALAVACLEEALSLRAGGVIAPIVLLEGVLSAAEMQCAAEQDLQVVIHADWQFELALEPDAATTVWIKLDSGMHRLGFPLAAARSLYARIAASTLRLEGWMTHLACADDPEAPMTARQLAAFEQAVEGLPGARSIANSAGLMAWPRAHADWVRPGLMLYGASPFAGETGAARGLRPAMRVESRILALQDLEAGESVGYGAAFRAAARMRLGVVAVGYADGVHRILPSGAPVLIHGVRAPIIGRVSMDMISVDLREVPQTRINDPVLLWGEGLPVEEVAAWAGTLAYELFCGLTHRVHFIHHHGD